MKNNTGYYNRVPGFAENPLEDLGLCNPAPGRTKTRDGAQGGRRRPLPATAVAGGEGQGGEGLEEIALYLGVLSAQAGTAGGGGSTSSGGCESDLGP